MDLIREFLQLKTYIDKNGNVSILCKCSHCNISIQYEIASNVCPNCKGKIIKTDKIVQPSKIATKLPEADEKSASNGSKEQCEYCLKEYVSTSPHDTICPYCGHDNYWKV